LSNLLKAGYGYVKSKEETRVIDYNELIQEKLKEIRISLQKQSSGGNGEFVAGLNAEVVEELVNPEEELAREKEETDRLLKEAKDKVEQAKKEAEQLIEQARQEGEQLKKQAQAQGQDEGYRDGLARAQQEVDQLKASIQNEKEELEQDYEKKLKELEPKLVNTILEVFQKVTYVLAEDKKEMMLYLVDQALSRIESSHQFYIRVSKEDYPFVAEHKESLCEKVPTSSEIEIVRDSTLVRNQCLIETDGGVFDCSLDVQLENLISDIKVLSSI